MQSAGDRSSIRLVPGRAAGPRHVHFQLGHLRWLRHRLSGRSLRARTERLGPGELISDRHCLLCVIFSLSLSLFVLR